MLSSIRGVNEARVMGRVQTPPIRREGEEGLLIKILLEVDEPRFRGGVWTKLVSYHRVVLFGPIAESFDGKLEVGTFVFSEGFLKNTPYYDGWGEEHNLTEVIATRVIIPPESKKEDEKVPAKYEHRVENVELQREEEENVIVLFPEKEEEDEYDYMPF